MEINNKLASNSVMHWIGKRGSFIELILECADRKKGLVLQSSPLFLVVDHVDAGSYITRFISRIWQCVKTLYPW